MKSVVKSGARRNPESDDDIEELDPNVSPEDLFREWHGSNPDVDMFDSLPLEGKKVQPIGRAHEITYRGKWDGKDKFVHHHDTYPTVGAVVSGRNGVPTSRFVREGASLVYLGRLLTFVFEDLRGVMHAFKANPNRDEVLAVNTGVILLPRTPKGPLFLYGGSGRGLRITAAGIVG